MIIFLKRLSQSPSFLTVIGSGLRIAGGVLTLPLALRLIPTTEIGLYYTFIAIAGLVSLVDFGFAPTVARNAGYAMGGAKHFTPRGVPQLGQDGPNYVLLAELVGAVSRYYHICSMILLFLLGGLGSWYIWGIVENLELSINLFSAWLLFAGAQVYFFYGGYWNSLLLGIGEVRKAAQISLYVQLISLLTLIICLLSGLSLWSYGLSALLSAILTRWLSRKSFSFFARMEALESSAKNVGSVIKTLWPMAWRQGVVMLGAYGIQRGNTLICSARLGLEETAQYGLTVSIIAIVCQISVIPVNIAMPEIVKLRVTKNHNAIWGIFSRRIYLGLGFGAVSCVFIALFGNSILGLIGAKTFFLTPGLVILLSVVWLLETHHSQYGVLVLSENQNPFILPALISGVAIFLLSWWSAAEFGVFGLIAVQGIVQLCWNNWWTVLRAFRSIKAC